MKNVLRGFTAFIGRDFQLVCLLPLWLEGCCSLLTYFSPICIPGSIYIRALVPLLALPLTAGNNLTPVQPLTVTVVPFYILLPQGAFC